MPRRKRTKTLGGKLINQRLSGVEGQVNEMLELIQAREDVLCKAQLEMQGQVNFLAHQVREVVSSLCR
jgi:chaperonin cofactor prefoldin